MQTFAHVVLPTLLDSLLLIVFLLTVAYTFQLHIWIICDTRHIAQHETSAAQSADTVLASMHPLMWVVGINWNCGCALFRTIMTQLLEDDCFKEEFKRYKKKDADLNDVIDFTRSQGYEKEVRNLIPILLQL